MLVVGTWAGDLCVTISPTMGLVRESFSLKLVKLVRKTTLMFGAMSINKWINKSYSL